MLVPAVEGQDAYWTNGELMLAEAPMIEDPEWEAPEAPLIADPNWEAVEGEEAPMIPDPEWEMPSAPMIVDPAFTFVEAVEAIPKTYTLVEDAELLAQKQIKLKELEKQAKIAQGRADRAKCETALDLVAGYNRDRLLSMEQITQMQQMFAQAEALLRANRPDFAAQVISAIEPDGLLITQEMKDDVLSILQG
jgi:flagellar biosynthesis/type III secretory pathway protein FliH